MMYTFLANNRDELIRRCREKVARRPQRGAVQVQLETGIPIFLAQLERTLEAEEQGLHGISLRISGRSGGDADVLSEMGVTAVAHGRQLLELNYSIDQVVHDYGDLCQSITDLAVERDAPFGVDEFRTLNRCLDNAIADATTGFSSQRDVARDAARDAIATRQLGFMVHELRNALNTAMLSVAAMEHGSLPLSGATGGVLKRSHVAMKSLIDAALGDIKHAPSVAARSVFSVGGLIDDAALAAKLHATAKGCSLVAAIVDPREMVHGNRELLLAALANLLQNAFKFSHPGSEIVLGATVAVGKVRIAVKDHCGGLPDGDTDRMFVPFTQHGNDRTGLGLGLSIARHSVEADGGSLTVTDMPGEGCVFTLTLPSHNEQPLAALAAVSV